METDFDEREVSLCPSFNFGSDDSLTEIACRVASEINAGDCGDGDFEFSFLRKDGEILADEFFHNLRIESVFPLFDQDLLPRNEDSEFESRINIPSIEIFVEDKNDRDESEMVPTGAYCVWRPKNKSVEIESPTRTPRPIRKKKSAGSESPRSSSSNRKTDIVFLASSSSSSSSSRTGKEPMERSAVQANGKAAAVPRAKASSSAQASVIYVRYREMKEEEKKKSFLPYRQDLVGIFSHANAARRLPLL
ncbi:hypothetical protein M569_01474 [Genlisea aurea]|uniref:Uncharacterized protein n=1 Tax=Genlisea aurea TaxID=192259 RepID=S8EL02_9LAMI|nr:hypothetical protein M569_01474 [Genlisea aurea]